MTTQTKANTVPAGFGGTLPEYLVYQSLLKTGVYFTSQFWLIGAPLLLGSVEVDFLLSGIMVAINVNGLYWHYEMPGRMAQDQIQRLAVEGMGWMLIYIDEDDALRNSDFYAREAIMGQDHSRMTR